MQDSRDSLEAASKARSSAFTYGGSEAIAIVILAAGASTRMGRPKQLLPYGEHSFLRHTAEVAAASGYQPIVVVLGAYAEQTRPELNQLPVQVIENYQWSEGMSASIRVGIQALSTMSDPVEAAVLTLCDQPFVSVQVITQLIEAYQTTGQPIVASAYSGTFGVPALFRHSFFPKLMDLSGSEGAKQVIQKYTQEVVGIPFPAGVIDIDTPKDYEQFRAMAGLKLPMSSTTESNPL